MFFFTPISGSSLIYMCWPAYCLKITNCIQMFRDVSLCSFLLSVFQNFHSSYLCFQSSTIVSSVYIYCKTPQVLHDCTASWKPSGQRHWERIRLTSFVSQLPWSLFLVAWYPGSCKLGVCVSVCVCVCVCVSVCVCLHECMTPWTVAHQPSLSIEFSKQRYWSRLPLLTSGNLPDPGIKSTSLVPPALAGRFFYLHRLGSPLQTILNEIQVIHKHTCSVAKACPTLCGPMNCIMPGFSVLYYLLKFAQIHVHWVGDSIQTSHPLLTSSPLALNISQHQDLLQLVGSLLQVSKVLEFQHQSFQWIFRVDFL